MSTQLLQLGTTSHRGSARCATGVKFGAIFLQSSPRKCIRLFRCKSCATCTLEATETPQIWSCLTVISEVEPFMTIILILGVVWHVLPNPPVRALVPPDMTSSQKFCRFQITELYWLLIHCRGQILPAQRRTRLGAAHTEIRNSSNVTIPVQVRKQLCGRRIRHLTV